MNKNISPTYVYLLMGILFLTLSIRRVFIFEVYLEWGVFLLLLLTIVASYMNKLVWFAFFSYILIILYNPLFLIHHDINYTFILDLGVGILFFLMSLNWKKYTTST